MLPASDEYKANLHRPHRLAFEATLYAGIGGEVLARRVPVFGGTVTANLAHRVTRSGTFTLGPEWWPGEDPTAPLTPYQTIVNIQAGMRYGDGSTEMFDIITGRAGEVTRNSNGSVTARIDDLAADVIAYRFEQPRNSELVSILAQIQRLIADVIPGSVLGPTDVVDQPCPRLTWDEDRGKALDDLAASLGGRWYYLGDGTPVVRAYPYDVGTVVQTFEDGPEGLLSQGTPSISRDGAANSITLVVERFDGGAPFRVTARDTSPTSPTRFGGPFGKVSEVIKVQTPLTEGQATIAVRQQLVASTALSSKWTATVVPDFSLEPGDTVRLTSRGTSSVQLTDSITYPLFEGGTMGLSTRAYVRAQATLD